MADPRPRGGPRPGGRPRQRQPHHRGRGVPGGGVALLRAQEALDGLEFDREDEQIGANILRRAPESPIRQIAENSGAEPSIVVAKVRDGEGGYGYNAQTDAYENLVKAGVIDPTKVVRSAL